MAEIINPMQSKQDAEAAAIRMVETQRAAVEAKKKALEDSLQKISKASPQDGGFEEIAVLLALPDEHFNLLAPVFLAKLEQSYHNVNDQLVLIQSMNVAGMKAEDARNEYFRICQTIDDGFGDTLSYQKRDFLKQVMGMTYNAIAEAEGVAKKIIAIPIENCHEKAKIPTYAHLTDSGMDVYALEDITIAPGETKLIPIGIKIAIPSGYELQVRPKSGRCLKTKLRIANTPGTIDAGYRDEIGIIVDNIEPYIKSAKIDEDGKMYDVQFGSSYTIGEGEKFAQLVLCEVPKAAFYKIDHVSDIPNDGRDGGFGSSGLK